MQNSLIILLLKNLIIGLLLTLLILVIGDSSFIHIFKQFISSMNQMPFPQEIAAKVTMSISILYLLYFLIKFFMPELSRKQKKKVKK